MKLCGKIGTEPINWKMLSKEEIHRYSRHIILPEIGMEGQEKLGRAKVLVVGAGGLGCPVLQYLTAAGVGTIGIIDYDVVDETNLQRQILFMQEDIGKPKAVVAREWLSRANSICKLQFANCKLTKENALEIISQYDLVIDCSDNFPTRYLANDACVILGKPLVFGSIFKFEGQVSVFNYKGGPTYRCLFPEPPVDSSTCAEIGVLGVVPGIIGTIMANESLKIILGIGEVLTGKLFVFDALSSQTQIICFEKNPENSKIDSLIDYEWFCASSPSLLLEQKEGKAEIKEISVLELKILIEHKQALQIIDVREPSEFLERNMNGINIPFKTLSMHVEKIQKNIPVIVHCQRGGRSKKAIELLQKDFGFTNLYNLTGGIEALTPSEFSVR